MKKITSLIILLITIAFTSVIGAQNTLTIKISNLDKSKGKLMIGLYNSKSIFMIKEFRGQIIEVKDSSVKVIFKDLPKDEYAVAFFQDENQNGKLDQGLYFMPIENYGLSNNINPLIIKRIPTFEDCKFSLDKNKTIEIKCLPGFKVAVESGQK